MRTYLHCLCALLSVMETYHATAAGREGGREECVNGGNVLFGDNLSVINVFLKCYWSIIDCIKTIVLVP